MTLDEHIRTIIRETVKECLAELHPAEPELITIEDAAQLFNCDKSVIQNLIKNKEQNDFPAVILGQRTIRIDRHRLHVWLRDGGLR